MGRRADARPAMPCRIRREETRPQAKITRRRRSASAERPERSAQPIGWPVEASDRRRRCSGLGMGPGKQRDSGLLGRRRVCVSEVSRGNPRLLRRRQVQTGDMRRAVRAVLQKMRNSRHILCIAHRARALAGRRRLNTADLQPCHPAVGRDGMRQCRREGHDQHGRDGQPGRPTTSNLHAQHP